MKGKEEFFKISEGYSTQSKIVNQFWVILVICCVFTLISPDSIIENTLDLPFSLGKVKMYDFYQINIVLISLLTISFTSAMIQVIRTRQLIQIMIDGFENKNIIGSIHVQDFLDSILSPTYNRVAPISQYLLGKNQFFNQEPQKKYIKIVSTIFYILLKLTTFVLLYILPFIAIKKCWFFIINNHDVESNILIYNWILIFLTIIALLSILILLIGDIKYLLIVIKRIILK